MPPSSGTWKNQRREPLKCPRIGCHLIADSGCRNSVGGRLWHGAFQHALQELEVPFLQVQEREVYCFAAGAPVVSTVVLSLSSGAWPWGHHSDAVRRWRNHQLSRTDRAIRAESVEGRVSLWRKEVGAEWCGTTHGFHGTQASTSWAMTRSKFKKQFSSGTPVKVPGEKRFYRRRFGPRVL